MAAPRRRTHMVSATFPDAVERLAESFQVDSLDIEGAGVGMAHADIEHVVHVVRAFDRVATMTNVLLLAGDQRVLVFVATRAATAQVAERLSASGFTAQSLSGDLAQSQRTSTLEAFRSGTVRVLVATDVAARGLDVPEVATVIHGDLPMDSEVYTHRSGRTGRAGNKGRSIILATPNNVGRARRILHQAGVKPNLCPVPSAENVREAQSTRLRKDLAGLVEDGSPSGDLRVLAKGLLEGREAEAVVAALIGRVRERHGPAPIEIEDMPARPERPDRGDRPMASGRRELRVESGFTQFRINWGFRQGANPKRLLAVICRRGDVQGRMVGAIDVGEFEAVFGVKDDVARHFASNASRPDERHPDQRIEPFRAGAARSDSRDRSPSRDRHQGDRKFARGGDRPERSDRPDRPYRAERGPRRAYR